MNAEATARPIPDPAPVTIATRASVIMSNPQGRLPERLRLPLTEYQENHPADNDCYGPPFVVSHQLTSKGHPEQHADDGIDKAIAGSQRGPRARQKHHISAESDEGTEKYQISPRP